MAAPRNGHAERGSWDFEQDDAPLRVVDHSDASERHARFAALGHLVFELVQPLWIGAVIRANHGSRFVANAENEPR